MTDAFRRPDGLTPEACVRALGAHDPRFDGLFYVGITSTRIYCRPVCPARVAHPENRRFFDSAAAAEAAGYRPCLRCRPELAPGRSPTDALPRLARITAQRIAAGALNGQSVAQLAGELGVSERHLRRALERAIGVSPLELAQTHRLLLAKRLLADTTLPVTRVAFASGFQSLRRFNTLFRERYHMSPSALRRPRAPTIPHRGAATPNESERELVRLTLAYRAPFDWERLLGSLASQATPAVDFVRHGCYGRTIEIGGHRGVCFASRAADDDQLNVDISPSLLPALMPLLSRLRRLFDLDAEPAVVDEHLRQGGLGDLVDRHPGLRIAGAVTGFDAALRALLGDDVMRRVALAFGEAIDSGFPALTRLAPGAGCVAGAGVRRLTALGVAPRNARGIVAIARALADGSLLLDSGADPNDALWWLRSIDGVSERVATAIVTRALAWPDALPVSDPALQRAAGASGPRELRALAERWRPWRSYAALHLALESRRQHDVSASSPIP